MKSSVNPYGVVNRNSSPLNIAVALFWTCEMGRDWQPCAMCWPKSSLGFKLALVSSSKTKVPHNLLVATPDFVFSVKQEGEGGLVFVQRFFQVFHHWAHLRLEQSTLYAVPQTALTEFCRPLCKYPSSSTTFPDDVQTACSHAGPSAGRKNNKVG